MNEQELLQVMIKDIAKNEIQDAMYQLLHPEVQIVTPFELPQYASELSAGVDIQADLFGIQEKFLKKAEIWRTSDKINFDLQTAMGRGDEEAVEAFQKALDDLKEDVIEEICLYPGGQFLCPTGIHTSFDGIYEVQIRPRSGLALKKRLTITNSPGTLEGDYHDEWGVILANEGSDNIIIKQGDKIAQAVFSLIVRPTFVRKDSVADLTGSDRGGGFGHSDAH